MSFLDDMADLEDQLGLIGATTPKAQAKKIALQKSAPKSAPKPTQLRPAESEQPPT